ncbi:MAG: secretin and TonB N-terminal domain-containing protein [Candidatus Omnitrophica bacterium]|nr:secretin and TonB N-terminal domain-containing protein [Candidatus Omnitrophota bacterium]
MTFFAYGATQALAIDQFPPTEVEDRLKQTISLEYKDADLASVLRSLAWTYKINIVTGPDIKGKVSINLQDISVEKALQAILTINGLVYSKRDGVIYISSGDTQIVEIKTEVIQLKYLTATQAQNLSRKLLSSKGDMKINEVANNIIITDYQANIDKIRELLQQVDLAPKQVLIEAKIVDITSNDLRAMGVTWNFDYKPVGDTKSLFTRKTHYQEELKNTITMGEESSSLSGGQIVLNTLTLKGLTIGATIDALVRDGRANLLASPSIAVINGQEARIVIGERYPYKEKTQTTSGTTETTKFLDIGTTLKVNPQINDDGYITMSIHPEVSAFSASLDAGPRITTREADTTVRVKEGETLVIGGLIKQTNEGSRDKVPILGDIPILGILFSRSEGKKEQTELAVFITPRVLFSREEKMKLGRKKADLDDSDLLTDQTSPLTVVERIYEKAVNLDRGVGLESIRKQEIFRKAQALSHYEIIYKQFPESKRAPEAKYLAALILKDYYKDYRKARLVLLGIIQDYPKSEFSAKAKKTYEEIEDREKSDRKEKLKKAGIKPPR